MNAIQLLSAAGRLLGQSKPVSRTLSGPGVMVSAILLAVTAFGVFGQSPARPAFVVASIKPTSTDRSHMMVAPRPGGRITAENASLRLLMQNAYRVQAFQISGGPGWIDSEGYDIEAKAEGNASQPQLWLMLQTLLEDRFQLKIHRETRELPVYALTVAKSGPKLRQPKEGGCITLDPGMPPPPGQQPGMFPCGRAGIFGNPSGGAQMQGGKVPMAEFTRILAIVMGRPIIDKTGFTEPFDFHLEFTPDDTAAGLLNMGPVGSFSPAAAADPAAPPSIFSAIQEQLGLKLESAKGPVEVIVIDHVERPTGN